MTVSSDMSPVSLVLRFCFASMEAILDRQGARRMAFSIILLHELFLIRESARREKCVRVAGLAFPVGENADEIARHAPAANVKPTDVITLLVQRNAGEQLELVAVAR